MIAAGALHISLKAKPTSSAAKDWVASGARMLTASTGAAAIVAPTGKQRNSGDIPLQYTLLQVYPVTILEIQCEQEGEGGN